MVIADRYRQLVYFIHIVIIQSLTYSIRSLPLPPTSLKKTTIPKYSTQELHVIGTV